MSFFISLKQLIMHYKLFTMSKFFIMKLIVPPVSVRPPIASQLDTVQHEEVVADGCRPQSSHNQSTRTLHGLGARFRRG